MVSFWNIAAVPWPILTDRVSSDYTRLPTRTTKPLNMILLVDDGGGFVADHTGLPTRATEPLNMILVDNRGGFIAGASGSRESDCEGVHCK